MRSARSHSFAIAVLSIAMVAWPAASQSPRRAFDADAEAIYAALLPPAWARSGSNGVLLLQRETVAPFPCRGTADANDAEWDAVEKSYVRAHPPAQVLPASLRLGVPYRFVARSTIAAEDARLKRKYPGYNGLPGARRYAAVSVVGFNSARTRAMVYVRLRDSGDVHSMEKRDGKWVHARRAVCHWGS